VNATTVKVTEVFVLRPLLADRWCSFVHSFLTVGRRPAYSGPQRWDLM